MNRSIRARSSVRPDRRKLSDVARHVVLPKDIATTGWPKVEAQARLCGIEYDGYDVVEGPIRWNHDHYGAPNIRFHLLEDGTRLESRADAVPGDAAQPMTEEAVRAKFLRFAAPVLGDDAARAVLGAMLDGDGALRPGPMLLAPAAA